jgi:hypothetical protein
MITITTIFWNVTPCSPVDIYGCFGGVCCLCIQDHGRTINLASNVKAASERTLLAAVHPSEMSVRLILPDYMAPQPRRQYS